VRAAYSSARDPSALSHACSASFGYFRNGGGSAPMPGAVCLSSREMELPDGSDPVARQHRQRKVFG